MNLRRFLIAIFIFTNLSLAYIFLQVQIYDLGYRGETKKTELSKLKDINADLSNYIYKLKSANHIGVKMLTNGSHLQFLDSSRVFTLEAPKDVVDDDLAYHSPQIKVSKKSSFFEGLLSLKSQAEAEPIK